MIEVLKQAADDVSKAYDVLAFAHTERAAELLAKTRTSLRKAIAEVEKQEPVAWISPSGALYRTRYHAVGNAEQSLTPLYTHPPQRTWVGLTDEEAQWLYDNCRTPSNLIDMVEAKLKEKNT